jgi:hypothetical protein
MRYLNENLWYLDENQRNCEMGSNKRIQKKLYIINEKGAVYGLWV